MKSKAIAQSLRIDCRFGTVCLTIFWLSASIFAPQPQCRQGILWSLSVSKVSVHRTINNVVAALAAVEASHVMVFCSFCSQLEPSSLEPSCQFSITPALCPDTTSVHPLHKADWNLDSNLDVQR
jgi:hypothetical protein